MERLYTSFKTEEKLREFCTNQRFCANLLKTAITQLYIKHQLDAQIIIYSYNVTIRLHVSSNKLPSSGGHIVYTQPMINRHSGTSEGSNITKT
jgi:hypothetical protein